MKIRLVVALGRSGRPSIEAPLGQYLSIQEKRIQERNDMRKLMMAALFALPMFGATAMAQDTTRQSNQP